MKSAKELAKFIEVHGRGKIEWQAKIGNHVVAAYLHRSDWAEKMVEDINKEINKAISSARLEGIREGMELGENFAEEMINKAPTLIGQCAWADIRDKYRREREKIK